MFQGDAVIERMLCVLAAGLIPLGFLSSCGSSDGPMLAGNVGAASGKAEEDYRKAKAADDAGKAGKAIKLYGKVADRYPFAPSSAQARYRQAELLHAEGEIIKAFDAYDMYLTRYPSSNRYNEVLKRQAQMAQSAAEGDLKSGFLGLKMSYSLEEKVKMLEKVVAQAPKSRTASKAQLTLGEVYQTEKNKSKSAIAAYRKLVADQPDSPEAPEALYRTGIIMLEEANRGNQNQANLDLAREAFEDYLLQYPGHSRNGEARGMLKTLQGKDLERSFAVAEFYLKTRNYEAAKVYFRDISKKDKSGDLGNKSRQRLKELGE